MQAQIPRLQTLGVLEYVPADKQGTLKYSSLQTPNTGHCQHEVLSSEPFRVFVQQRKPSVKSIQLVNLRAYTEVAENI
jgi:hypothetical protein